MFVSSMCLRASEIASYEKRENADSETNVRVLCRLLNEARIETHSNTMREAPLLLKLIGKKNGFVFPQRKNITMLLLLIAISFTSTTGQTYERTATSATSGSTLLSNSASIFAFPLLAGAAQPAALPLQQQHAVLSRRTVYVCDASHSCSLGYECQNSSCIAIGCLNCSCKTENITNDVVCDRGLSCIDSTCQMKPFLSVTVIALIAGSVLLTLLIASASAIAVFCVHKRKRNFHIQASSSPEDVELQSTKEKSSLVPPLLSDDE
jgi:hypothetical protein